MAKHLLQLSAVLHARKGGFLRASGWWCFLAALLLHAPLTTAEDHIQPYPEALVVELKQWLDDYVHNEREQQGLPGLSLAVSLPQGETVTATAGVVRKDSEQVLTASDRFLGGSTGKTYVAALILMLAEEGELALDAKAADYLGHIEWFPRLPNADRFTVAQLLNHSAGIPHYIDDTGFLWRFAKDSWLGRDTGYSPETMLSFVLDDAPTTAPGEAHVYSDLNYFVLGLVIEAVTGQRYYEVLTQRLLEPHRLEGTLPSNRYDIPRLVTGYSASSFKNRLLGVDGATIENGRLTRNPAIEWTGGGLANTPAALAQFYQALGAGRILSGPGIPLMASDVLPVSPGAKTQYGYGVFLSEREELGRYISHAGWYPGYNSNVAYFERGAFAVAIQTNRDYAADIYTPVREIAARVQEALQALDGAAIEYRFSEIFSGEVIARQRLRLQGNKASVYFEQRTQGKQPYVQVDMTRDDQLIPTRMSRRGLAYLYHEIKENYELSETGEARWSNRVEQETATPEAPRYYVPFSMTNLGASAPAEEALLAQALLQSDNQSLSLLPRGMARLRRLARSRIDTNWGSQELQLVTIEGLSLTPPRLWLDLAGNDFARVDVGALIRNGHEAALDSLRETEAKALAVDKQRQRQNLARVALDSRRQPLHINHVNVVDPGTGEVRRNMRVQITDGRITGVSADPDSSEQAPDSITLDGKGGYLIPGLWDRHVHLNDTDRVLHLLGGVTTVVDLGNDNARLRALEQRMEAEDLPGPRVIKAGFIDKRGEIQTPIGRLVQSEADAMDAIDAYAAEGFHQIKLYGAIDPTWLPAIARRAHARGLRLSGHIPTKATTIEAIAGGYDDIQHVIYLWLNFVEPPVLRELTFTAARAFEQSPPDDRELERLLQAFVENDVGLDPTLAVYEEFLRSRRGQPKPAYRPYRSQLPLQTFRLSKSGPLPTPEDVQRGTFARLFDRSLELVGKLHELGGRVVPGSDHRSLPGLSFIRELELLQEAGIPPRDILRLATRDAAEAYDRADQSGAIAPGQQADLVLLVDNPLNDVAALRSARWVLSRGRAYPVEALWKTVLPWQTRQP